MRVVAVMLVNGRQEMVDRAIRSFHSQTYQNKVLQIFDSGMPFLELEQPPGVDIVRSFSVTGPRPIGTLRNEVNEFASQGGADVIAHWDSDDWSAPGRLTDQVDLLESSGADVVGYSEMLFWKHPMVADRDRSGERESFPPMPKLVPQPGEAWLYSSPNPNYCIGTSLLYRAEAWRRRPFKHLNTAEDTEFCNHMKCSATSAGVREPLMIASIHSGNTCARIQPGKKEWKRAAYADDKSREAMKL